MMHVFDPRPDMKLAQHIVQTARSFPKSILMRRMARSVGFRLPAPAAPASSFVHFLENADRPLSPKTRRGPVFPVPA